MIIGKDTVCHSQLCHSWSRLSIVKAWSVQFQLLYLLFSRQIWYVLDSLSCTLFSFWIYNTRIMSNSSADVGNGARKNPVSKVKNYILYFKNDHVFKGFVLINRSYRWAPNLCQQFLPCLIRSQDWKMRRSILYSISSYRGRLRHSWSRLSIVKAWLVQFQLLYLLFSR